MTLPPPIQASIAALADDNTSGATEITKHAAAVAMQLTDPKAETADAELRLLLRESAYAFARAQPAMAPMLNLADKILRMVRESDEPPELRERLRSLMNTYANQLDTATSRIALHAREVLPPGSRILTHSYSSAVKKTLLSLFLATKKESVTCTESRPMKEGIELGRELAGHGIPVTLITDAAAFSVLPTVSCVVLGADSVSTRGVVNKVGSSGIALAASSLSIPVYILCGSEKFIPEELVVIGRRGPRELLAEDIANLTVHNVYFDVTPLRHVTGVITEEGFHTPAQIQQHLGSLEQKFILKASDLER